MAKRFGYTGHPAERVSIRDVRKQMGCATKTEKDALVLATYGECESHFEIGAHIKLLIVAPEVLAVERRTGLSGEKSAGMDRREGSAAEGWLALPDEPDVDQTAK
jgi:hypothetical protein